MSPALPFLLSLCLLTDYSLAQNILNNGGFEYGLMCYNAYAWGVTGDDNKSDYRFFLSSDSHSGSSSLELRCTGPDCAKAAAISNRIPTQPNQAYKLSLYTKCAAGATPAVYIPGMTGGDVFRYMSCTGDWAPNTITFTTSATAKDFFYYLFDYYPIIGASSRFDDVVLTYADGTAPAEAILHPGVRDVQVKEKFIQVDGAPYLNLGFFDVNYDDLAQVASLGANTVHALGEQPAANCFNTTQTAYLDRMYELGLNFVPQSSTTAQAMGAATFPAIMQRFASHRSIIAWMLADEPDQSLIPRSYIQPANFIDEYNAAKTKTTLPLFSDMQRSWSTITDVSPYTPGLDFWMAEPYGPDFQGVNHAVNMFNSLRRRPIWLAQDDIDPRLIVPKAYWAIINGATGIVYFYWPTFKANAPLLAKVQQAFSELKQLQSVIFSQPVDALVSTSNGLGYMARYTGTSTYILAANPAVVDLQGSIFVKGLMAGQQINVLFENRTITADSGGFTDSFFGPARHVYVINSALSALSGTLAGKSGVDSARDWKIQVSNTGTGVANAVQIGGATFAQSSGTACTPKLVPGNLPVMLGNIGSGGNATGDVMINFTGCDNTSKFSVNISLSSNNGAVNAAMVRNNERK